jgi:hypothetical protein
MAIHEAVQTPVLNKVKRRYELTSRLTLVSHASTRPMREYNNIA